MLTAIHTYFVFQYVLLHWVEFYVSYLVIGECYTNNN